MDITLDLLISDWLKLRGLKWWYNPKLGYLKMDQEEPSSVEIFVKDDHVLWTPFRFGSPRSIVIMAADPLFFVKLEIALRHEERMCHFGRVLLMLFNGVDKVWGVPLGIFCPWLLDLLDNVERWCRKIFHKLRSTQIPTLSGRHKTQL